MRIKEFVKEVIGDISDAVNELNKEKFKDGLIVGPSDISRYGEAITQYEDGRIIRNIEFNISVTVSDKNEAGGGLMVSIVKAGINNESTNSSTNSIKFSIPIVLPPQRNE